MFAPHDWMDRVIAEQAKYYGMTLAQHAKYMAEICEAQELADEELD